MFFGLFLGVFVAPFIVFIAVIIIRGVMEDRILDDPDDFFDHPSRRVLFDFLSFIRLAIEWYFCIFVVVSALSIWILIVCANALDLSSLDVKPDGGTNIMSLIASGSAVSGIVSAAFRFTPVEKSWLGDIRTDDKFTFYVEDEMMKIVNKDIEDQR